MSVVQIIGPNGGTAGGGGGSASSLITENLSSQVNGTNINFSTGSEYTDGTLQVFYNGLLQIKNEDYTEDSDNLGITFALAPEVDSKVVVLYSEAT